MSEFDRRMGLHGRWWAAIMLAFLPVSVSMFVLPDLTVALGLALLAAVVRMQWHFEMAMRAR